MNDLKKRYLVDKQKLGTELGIQSFKLNQVTAYKNYDAFKALASQQQVIFDGKANAIIVPILIDKQKGYINYATFHLRMIKNTSITKEKNLTYLRINFHNP